MAILDFKQNNFLSASHPDTFYQVSNQLATGIKRSSTQIFKMAAVAAILDFRSEKF